MLTRYAFASLRRSGGGHSNICSNFIENVINRCRQLSRRVISRCSDESMVEKAWYISAHLKDTAGMCLSSYEVSPCVLIINVLGSFHVPARVGR
ncbi:hypothetical protein B0H17DRAFT_1092283 [Mycena rosella]|uniref:Uncharacterized protein n=1 Tax=Mycena rosella TaxID=1033263 RepID=A0AAD7CUH3_MYCRO|nr:hypothetical protein B0H17DRAFT_1092283 [Mycena rosella]